MNQLNNALRDWELGVVLGKGSDMIRLLSSLYYQERDLYRLAPMNWNISGEEGLTIKYALLGLEQGINE